MTGAYQTIPPEAYTGRCARLVRKGQSRKECEPVRAYKPLYEQSGAGAAAAPDEDAALIARAGGGDRVAYAALVRRHLPRVLAVTRRMLGNEAQAEEAAQEALLRLWTHAASYDAEKARLTTWLTRIAANICLDRIRKKSEEAWPEGFDVALAPNQERALNEDQVAAKVNAALQTLPERQRLALILCHYEDMSMAEAAGVMETTPEAVESLLSRGRRALRKLLEPEWRSLLTNDLD
jgi:RNA polymerase sigma-70 factor (ECF subfamily)